MKCFNQQKAAYCKYKATGDGSYAEAGGQVDCMHVA